jgi:hypothetical protein
MYPYFVCWKPEADLVSAFWFSGYLAELLRGQPRIMASKRWIKRRFPKGG